jgi:hypothetical protein
MKMLLKLLPRLRSFEFRDIAVEDDSSQSTHKTFQHAAFL